LKKQKVFKTTLRGIFYAKIEEVHCGTKIKSSESISQRRR
jgi:hypothetical protein